MAGRFIVGVAFMVVTALILGVSGHMNDVQGVIAGILSFMAGCVFYGDGVA